MFAAPLFLFGLLAAAVPLVIHLRRARHVRRIVFSTTRFFDEAFIRAARRARLQDRLLMLLRMALIMLFVLALAQPLLKLPGLGALGGGRRQVAIVIDDSASMRMATGRGVLLDRAKAAAGIVLDELSPGRGDKATLILAGLRDGGATVLFEQPTSDFDAVREAIDQVTPTDLATDLNAALQAGIKSLGGESGASSHQRDVYIISDVQQSAFAPGTIEALDEAANLNLMFVTVRPTAELAGDNVSVDAVQYGSSRPMVGVPYVFRALVTNHSDNVRKPALRLTIDDDPVAEKQVSVAPGRSEVIRFVHRFAESGWSSGRVELDDTQTPDAQPADNARHFVVRVESTVALLAVNGSPSKITANDELFYLRTALAAAQRLSDDAADSPQHEVRVEQISPGALDAAVLDRHSLVALSNVAGLQPRQVEAIELFVDAGGSLLITLGDRVDAEAYNQWHGPHRLHGGLLPGPIGALVSLRRDTPAGDALPADAAGPGVPEGDRITSIDMNHPLLSPFAEAKLGYLSAVEVHAHYRVVPPRQGVLMSTASGTPLLLEKRFGRGRVLLWTSSIDKDWTNFPLQPAYLPWVYRVVSYLAAPVMDRSGFVRTGQIVALPASTLSSEQLVVTRPDGGRAYPQLIAPDDDSQTAEAVRAVAATEVAGVYRLSRQQSDDAGNNDAVALMFAANPPAREAQPAYLSEAQIRGMLVDEKSTPMVWVDDDASLAEAVQVARQGLGLWDQLLILALAVALFEPWVANRLSKRRGGRADDALDRRTVVAPGEQPHSTPQREVA